MDFSKIERKVASIVKAAGKIMERGAGTITEKNGSLLIFDEIVTGFRIAIGGVQEYFGVTPDLAVFAKGIANGMPLSTYLGKREIMHCADRGQGVSISSTYGGETLSLAACKAAIKTYREQDVVGHIRTHGDYLWSKVDELFRKYDYPMTMKGMPACKAFRPTADAKGHEPDAFFRACFANGVSLYNVSYVNFSHQYADLDETLVRMEKALQSIRG